MDDIVLQATQWIQSTQGQTAAIAAAAAVYISGVATRYNQYETFCKQTFAQFRSDVLIEQCDKNKLDPTKVALLLEPLEGFIAAYMRRAVILAILWPIIVPIGFVLDLFSDDATGEAEMASWLSGLSMAELFLASVIRFSAMNHNAVLLDAIIKLTLVNAQMGDALQKEYLKQTRVDEQSEDK